jgi:hypothetical protein
VTICRVGFYLEYKTYSITISAFTPSLLLQIPKVLLSGDSVSASFGGYHASAGLGGTLDGGPAGGLFAEAGTPDGTGASAGLGGSVGSGGVLYSQAGVGGEAATGGAASSATSSAGTDNRLPRPTKRPADFYDNVFNVSILTFTPCRGG